MIQLDDLDTLIQSEYSNSSLQSPNLDIFKESLDRMLKENNLIIFNVTDCISDDFPTTINLIIYDYRNIFFDSRVCFFKKSHCFTFYGDFKIFKAC